MSGRLLHLQSKIIREALISLSLGTDPTTNNPWPIFAPFEPDTPDNSIIVQDTVGIESGADARTGGMHEHYGAQVLVRTNNHDAGFVKANEVFDGINRAPGYITVTVESTQYCIQSMYCTGPLIDQSRERTGSDRDLFFINVLATIDKI